MQIGFTSPELIRIDDSMPYSISPNAGTMTVVPDTVVNSEIRVKE